MNSELIQQIKLLPNQITLLRIFCFPVLWVLALAHLPKIFAAVLIFVGMTDIFDGYFARKMKIACEFGAKFDSFADSIFAVSIIFWLWILLPGFFAKHIMAIVLLFALYLLKIFLSFAKFGKMPHYHTYLAKFTTITSYVFASHALLFAPSILFFYFVAIIIIVSNSEHIFLILTSHKIDSDKKSAFE
ncbi:MAG TPA: CDP-alcohol phosphatidyltransferase family protein [Nanoarchaeota archaeon]|nr:CDP-alcohol phosphatidyltransferase family protein [Nanoarchaeota archaeon]